MITGKFRSLATACCVFVVLSMSSLVFGQVTSPQTTAPQATSTTARSVPSGAKMKFKGVVISRDADTFTIRDRTRTDYQVLLTDRTSIKTYGGFFKRGKDYAVTDILRGLIVEVEGKGDPQGQ